MPSLLIPLGSMLPPNKVWVIALHSMTWVFLFVFWQKSSSDNDHSEALSTHKGSGANLKGLNAALTRGKVSRALLWSLFPSWQPGDFECRAVEPGCLGPILSPPLPEEMALGELPLRASVSLAFKWTEHSTYLIGPCKD